MYVWMFNEQSFGEEGELWQLWSAYGKNVVKNDAQEKER